ncbi:MAG: nucleotidyltransferase family protein [Ruminococcus sp.]
MKTAGIIAEYNPFHTGHEYQINYIKEKLRIDYVVIAMSGDFVQRGTPALFSKYVRAEMALRSGADLVLELPVSISSASAELFARGGVQLLDGLGVTDILCFGSECGDTDALMELAKILAEEPEAFRGRPSPESERRNDFSKGQKHGSLCSFSRIRKIPAIALFPNNILGIEYCKAILRENSSISPVSIKREGNDYHENTLSENHFPSASAIRNAILDFNAPPKGDSSDTEHSHCFLSESPETSIQNFAFLADMAKNFYQQIPWNYFLQAISGNRFLLENDLDTLYRYCLLQETEESLCTYLDMSHALARRILSCRDQYETFSQFASLLKTKEITQTRIQRALLHMLLHIQSVPAQIPYAQVLGFRKNSSALLGKIKKCGSIPLLTKLPDAAAVLENAPQAMDLLNETTFASNLYESILAQKNSTSYVHEYRQQIIIV